MRWAAAFLCLTMAVGQTGCRCAPGFDGYANFIDDLHDQQVMWDQWYLPRLDISRAGKPDWCGPINSRLGPCRCCNQGSWDRADECWRYPSAYPYVYPARTLTMTTIHGPMEHGPTEPSSIDSPLMESTLPASIGEIPPTPGYEESPMLLPPAPPPVMTPPPAPGALPLPLPE